MTKRRREKLMFRVGKGVLEPADGYTRERLREKGFHVGDLIAAELSKPRNSGFHRKVHLFGECVAQNIDDFHGMQAHQVLKRLQLEANIGCEEVAYQIPNHGMVVQRIPMSLSFASMDEAEFLEVYKAMCRHVCDRYWPELEPEQVEEMGELMEGAA